ncbi:RNA polymerase sigma factor [Metabacillus herbersteinensis]|uniref:RNA polymerase sigma factor n=1 Tax=Metabacillus herbersteinensis TaxID=283816 RepID=A0ABV6GIJ8_9BACI
MKNWHSLEDLYQQYHSEIFRYLFKRVRHKETAQDLAQETFLKAFNGLASFKGQSSVKTWLYTIAHNSFINWYRKEMNYTYNSIDNFSFINENADQNPEEYLAKKVRQEQVMDTIYQLKEDFQHVIILREFQELSYQEISEVLGWKISKVKTSLHRAKLEFRKTLSKAEDDRYEV